jgi:nucleotide-binding universal stress UspA family protein
MYKHLLAASDGSDLAKKAVDHALTLARAVGAQVTVITVTEPWEAVIVAEASIVLPPANYDEAVAAQAARLLAAVKEGASAQGVVCETLHVQNRQPGEGIVQTAEERGCDLIVMASHGRRGVSRLLLGSVANEVVTHSRVPVLIVR